MPIPDAWRSFRSVCTLFEGVRISGTESSWARAIEMDIRRNAFICLSMGFRLHRKSSRRLHSNLFKQFINAVINLFIRFILSKDKSLPTITAVGQEIDQICRRVPYLTDIILVMLMQ